MCGNMHKVSFLCLVVYKLYIRRLITPICACFLTNWIAHNFETVSPKELKFSLQTPLKVVSTSWERKQDWSGHVRVSKIGTSHPMQWTWLSGQGSYCYLPGLGFNHLFSIIFFSLHKLYMDFIVFPSDKFQRNGKGENPLGT